MSLDTNHKTVFGKGASLILVAVLVLLFAGLVTVAVYFTNKQGLGGKLGLKRSEELSKVAEEPKREIEPSRIEFPYQVKSVENGIAVLSGKNGDLTLKKEYVTAIHEGEGTSAPEIAFEELKVGDTVRIEFVPNLSTTLFVSRSQQSDI